MRSLAWLLVLTASLLTVPSAFARDLVVLFEDRALRPGLCAALRIQLSDLASVECSEEPSVQPLSTRLSESAAEVTRRHARVGVLLERDPDARLLRMLLVGDQPDHALLAIERIEDRAAPDVDRSLALKVRDTLETMATVERATTPAPLPLAATLAPRPLAVPMRRLALLLEAGGALGVSSHTRGAGVVGLGLRGAYGLRYLEAMLAGQLSSELRQPSRQGVVVEDESGLALSIRAGRAWSWLSLGALVSLELTRVQAEGVTASGERGRDVRWTPRLGVGLDLRASLFETASTKVCLRLAPTLQLDPIAQVFQLDRQTTLELGRARLWIPLSLLVSLSPRGDDA